MISFGVGFAPAASAAASAPPTELAALPPIPPATANPFSIDTIGFFRIRAACSHAIAAIGNPGRFFSMLRAHGLSLDEHPLPDHAAIPRALLGNDCGQAVLMTEKDAVKCPDGSLRNAWYVEVDARVEGSAANSMLDRIVSLARDRNLGV